MFPDKSNPQQQEANYSERLLVGYRFYDQHQIEPAFPFGHVSHSRSYMPVALTLWLTRAQGLSYTSFHYSGLKASSSAVSLTLLNNGTVAGSEVVQLCTSQYACVASTQQASMRQRQPG